MRGLGVVFAIVMCGCTDTSESSRFAVPAGAHDVKHVALQPGVAVEDHFFLNEPFPGSSAISHYERVFAEWRPCFWPERDWDVVPDSTVDPPRLLQRKVRYWAAPRNTEWVMVAIQYESPGLADRPVPARDEQQVVLVNRKSQDAISDLELVGAKCEEAPNKSLERTREG